MTQIVYEHWVKMLINNSHILSLSLSAIEVWTPSTLLRIFMIIALVLYNEVTKDWDVSLRKIYDWFLTIIAI